MTDTTPKACPFCGGEANTEIRHSRIDGVKDRHFPSCLNGDCPAFIVEPYVTYSTKREALTAWNTRANADARLVEALEEARTALSITRTNVMTEIGRCSDESRSPWAGVPEQLAKRIAKIDAALSEVSRG